MPTLREIFYPDCMGYLDLRAIKAGKVKQAFFMLDDNPGMKAFFAQYRKDHDLYFAISTRDANGGKKENIVEIPGLWVDIDFKDIPENQANGRIEAFPFSPTVIVKSGGGLHVYWIFKEPGDKGDIDQCETIMRGLAMRLGGDLASTDASRILRIPGTKNFKYKPPRDVVLSYSNGARYNLSDFDDFAVSSEAPSQNIQSKANINLDAIMQCRFLQHCQANAAALPEPHWYAMVTILAREQGGPALIHELSKPHKGYKRSVTDQKILHALNDTGPMTCDAIRSKCGFRCDENCMVRSPIRLPRIVETRETGETRETRVTGETGGNQRKLEKLENHSPIPERNIMQEVKDWLSTCDGTFSLHDVTREFNALAGSLLYNNIKLILSKLQKQNLIERIGSVRGVYRKVEAELEAMRWWEVCNEEYPLCMPLDIGELCKLMPRSIVVIAGEQNSAKSAIALNIAKANCETLTTHYFNSEMSGEELRERISCFDDVEPDHFRQVNFYPRVENFQDVIFPDDLNIIDFLEIHDDFWKIGGIFRALYDRLGQGCVVANIQKAPGKDWGRGGTMSIEKARLYVAVSTLFDKFGKPYNQAKIVKAKLYRNLMRNPNGMVRDFRVYGGAKILPLTDWDYPRK